MKPAFARAVLASFLLSLSGCLATEPVTRSFPPAPRSPQGVVRLFEWCWDHRDVTRYEEVFTSDFLFVFAPGDSAGNPFRDAPLGREQMLACARHLFVGGGSVAPAKRISLTLDDTLYPLDDSRPGKNPRWHKEIATNVDLAIVTTADVAYHVSGTATFFMVRGDSAEIPSDLGFGPDPTRWYIERMEDGTLSAGVAGGAAVASIQAARNMTWGAILALYQ